MKPKVIQSHLQIWIDYVEKLTFLHLPLPLLLLHHQLHLSHHNNITIIHHMQALQSKETLPQHEVIPQSYPTFPSTRLSVVYQQQLHLYLLNPIQQLPTPTHLPHIHRYPPHIPIHPNTISPLPHHHPITYNPNPNHYYNHLNPNISTLLNLNHTQLSFKTSVISQCEVYQPHPQSPITSISLPKTPNPSIPSSPVPVRVQAQTVDILSLQTPLPQQPLPLLVSNNPNNNVDKVCQITTFTTISVYIRHPSKLLFISIMPLINPGLRFLLSALVLLPVPVIRLSMS